MERAVIDAIKIDLSSPHETTPCPRCGKPALIVRTYAESGPSFVTCPVCLYHKDDDTIPHKRNPTTDLAACIVAIEDLQGVLKGLVDLYVVNGIFVRTTVPQTPETYAAWDEAIKAVTR